MYQTVGHDALYIYAEAMGNIPFVRRRISGRPLSLEKTYSPDTNPTDEVEDLYDLLKEVKDRFGVEAVSVGAIFSEYQSVRVENVCERLGLKMLAYLWKREQKQLMRDMINDGLDAILIKVAAMGLSPDRHLGAHLKDVYDDLVAKEETIGLNVCGEGGEFESFVLDCPLFKKRIVIDESEVVVHSNDAFAPVAFLRLKRLHLEDKC